MLDGLSMIDGSMIDIDTFESSSVSLVGTLGSMIMDLLSCPLSLEIDLASALLTFMRLKVPKVSDFTFEMNCLISLTRWFSGSYRSN